MHLSGFAPSQPPDLLDAVIQFVDVFVGVPDVGVPVASGHVPSRAADGDFPFIKVPHAVDHFFQRTGLPSDLVDGHVAVAGVAAIASHRVHSLSGEQDERVMVAAVVHEITAGVGNILQHFSPLGIGFEIDVIGNLESQQVPVKGQRILGTVHVEAEVSQPANLEGPGHHHTAHAVLFLLRRRHRILLFMLAVASSI